MNILFLTVGKIDNLKSHGLYIDLINELSNKGNNVVVVTPNERRKGKDTIIEKHGTVEILRVKTGNITKTNFIEKGISTVLIEKEFITAIKKYYNKVKFDLVLFTTPPVTFEKVVAFIKKRDNCMSYLILKDIFPQNAVDLGAISKSGLIYKYFRSKEKGLYNISDYIGCTSSANIEYILRNNTEICQDKVELFPNSINPRSLSERSVDTTKIRKKYGLPEDAVVFVYGGNIGKPQGIDFVKTLLQETSNHNNLFFVILGSGTEFVNLSNFITESKFRHVRIHNSLSQDEYWKFLSCCDVGLIFLDKRFTVPNTPARLTYYMESALPILAATDSSTDINKILQDANCGFWVESGDTASFLKLVEKLTDDEKLRKKLGSNGRNYLEMNYTIEKNYQTIINHIKGRKIENV